MFKLSMKDFKDRLTLSSYRLPSPEFDEKISTLISEVAKIDQLYFPYKWDDSGWDAIQKSSGSSYYLAVLRESVGCRPIAFVLYQLFDIESLAHMLKLLVVPDYRSNGLARHLIAASFAEFQKFGIERSILEVECQNINANRLYISMGYKIIHTTHHFYSNGQSAHTMEKQLYI